MKSYACLISWSEAERDVLQHLLQLLPLLAILCNLHVPLEISLRLLEVAQVGVQASQLGQYVLVLTESLETVLERVQALREIELLRLVVLLVLLVYGPGRVQRREVDAAGALRKHVVDGEEQLFGERVVLLVLLCDRGGVELLYRVRLCGEDKVPVVAYVPVVLLVRDDDQHAGNDRFERHLVDVEARMAIWKLDWNRYGAVYCETCYLLLHALWKSDVSDRIESAHT